TLDHEILLRAVIRARRRYGTSPRRCARHDSWNSRTHSDDIWPWHRNNCLQTKAGPLARARLVVRLGRLAAPIVAIVVAVVGVGDAVVVAVAPRATLAAMLVTVGDAVTIAVPAARHVAPLLAAAGVEALPVGGHVAIARTFDHPLAPGPDVPVVHQHVMT